MAKQSLNLIVRSRQGVVFEGPVRAISAINKTGPFDVLPEHTNFVSIISKGLTVHKLDNTNMEIKAEQGVIVVESNQIRVFFGVGKI